MPWSRSAGDDWIALSARLQRFIAGRSGHHEVIVRIAPTETDSATTWPSGYQPGIAEVLIDARAVLDQDDDPVEIDPNLASDRAEFPLLTGWVCMAAAHVAHTSWPIHDELRGGVATVARGLEQARVCRSYLREHPADRRWIRAAARTLFSHEQHQDFLGLIGLARAGVLLDIEVAPILEAYRASMPADALDEVLSHIDAGLDLDDGDIDGLIDVATRIAAAIGVADEPPRSGLATAVDSVLSEVTGSATATSPSPMSAAFGTQRELDTDLRIQDRSAATSTFNRDFDRLPVVRREPSEPLRQQARGLLAQLRAARFRAPRLELVPSALPPGRLRLSEAMRAEAQRAAHARVTARPWRQLRRHPVEQPRLKVGLSWDISRSRSGFREEMADLAWSIAWAVSRLDGEVAAVAWNSSPVPVVWPGRVPHEVIEPVCRGGSSACPQSLRALSGAMGLGQDDSASLVVVMTDLQITNRRFVQLEVDRLADHGVPVLWLTPSPDDRAPRGSYAYAQFDGGRLSATVGAALVGVLTEHYDPRS